MGWGYVDWIEFALDKNRALVDVEMHLFLP
jgi:hypothetical protein